VSKFTACKIVEVANFQKKLAQVQQCANLQFGSLWARPPILHARERSLVLAFSVGDQCVVRPNRIWGQTSMNIWTILPTSVASEDRLILLGGVVQSYVRN